MKQIQLVKSLTFYNTTLKQNVLMVGKGTLADDFISNGSWLLPKRYFTPKSIEKWNLIDTFKDTFINSYANDKGKAQHDVDISHIQTYNDLYFVKVANHNLIIDNEVKERIIDTLAEDKDITFKFYETPYINIFLHVFEKDEFVGLISVKRG